MKFQKGHKIWLGKKHSKESIQKMIKTRQKTQQQQRLDGVRRYFIPNYWRKKFQLYDLLGGAKCVRCGITDVLVLQFDHIKSSGNKDLIALPMMNRYLEQPILAKETLQVLCANCNWRKRYTNLEASHRGSGDYIYIKHIQYINEKFTKPSL